MASRLISINISQYFNNSSSRSDDCKSQLKSADHDASQLAHITHVTHLRHRTNYFNQKKNYETGRPSSVVFKLQSQILSQSE